MYKLIEKAGGIYYSSEEKYFYRQRKGSITKSCNINMDCIEAAKEVFEYFKKSNNEELIAFSVQALVFSIIGVYNAKLCAKGEAKELKMLRNEALKYKCRFTYKELSFSRKIQVFLFFRFKSIYNIAFKIFDLKRSKLYK